MSSSSLLGRWGRYAARHAWWVIGAWVVVFLAAGAYGASVADRLTTEGGYNEQADSWHSYELLQRDFRDASPDVSVIYSSAEMTVDDPRFRKAVGDVVGRLPKDLAPTVVDGLTAPASSGLVSPDRHAVRLWVSLPTGEVNQVMTDYRELKPQLVADGVRTDIGGIVAMGDDLSTMAVEDTARAEMIALPIVFVLGLFIFGSLTAALLPSMVGAIAMTLALAALRLVTDHTNVATHAMIVVSLLGMGLAIDYTLFVVTRFREELGTGRGREPAVAAMGPTMATAGRTVVVSGVIVAVSLAGLFVFPLTGIRSLAWGAIPAVLGAMAAAVTLLPAVLAVLSHRVNSLRLPWTRRHSMVGREADSRGFWARVAHHVMARPWTYLILTTAALLACATPFLGSRWGGADEAQLPLDAPSRVALQTEAKHFGGDRTWGYVMVEGGTPADAAAYLSRLDAVPGVEATHVLGHNSEHEVTFANITWRGEAQSNRSQELVRAMRQVPDPVGAHTYIGGPSALAVDQLELIRDRLPWMLAVVGSAMFVLLLVAFRSVLLPLKAIVTSAISITASFGVITWVFQHGHLAGLLGFDPPGFLEVSTPIVMGAILFGLSMDYEVFLLSRIREEWDRTGDNTTSVAHGLARTGRIITGAALLLAVVIGAFATSGVVFVKMIGVGMLVAVLLDATVVRGLLVPATMKLLGRWNWWLPGSRG